MVSGDWKSQIGWSSDWTIKNMNSNDCKSSIDGLINLMDLKWSSMLDDWMIEWIELKCIKVNGWKLKWSEFRWNSIELIWIRF